jgi:hypothetical protein
VSKHARTILTQLKPAITIPVQRTRKQQTTIRLSNLTKQPRIQHCINIIMNHDQPAP